MKCRHIQNVIILKQWKLFFICAVGGSHITDCKDCCLLGCELIVVFLTLCLKVETADFSKTLGSIYQTA
jgi:hypothetical protein